MEVRKVNPDELIEHTSDDYNFNPTDSDDYQTTLDKKSGVSITSLAKSDLCHCDSGEFDYNLLRHDYTMEGKIIHEYSSEDPNQASFSCAKLGNNELFFLRELPPTQYISNIGKNTSIKTTLFVNSIEKIGDNIETADISYGLEQDRSKTNPNNYKFRLQLKEKLGRYFYSEDPFDSYLGEINLQGRIIKLPVVITHKAAQNAGLTLDQLRENLNIAGKGCLQGTYY